MKTTIRELRRKGYKRTTVKGLYLTNKGKAYNITTHNNLSIVRHGKVNVNGKEYNVAKLILETFKKIPVRNGAILFINGDKTDFDCSNLQYATGTHYKAPKQDNIIKVIRLYFKVDQKINSSSSLFKYFLKEIATKRKFIDLHTENDFKMFLAWLVPFSNSKAIISKEHGYTTINGTDAINKYLSLLINECLTDHENGLLQIMDFAPKTLTQTEKNIKINESAEIAGLNARVAIRKASEKEAIASFKAFKFGLQKKSK